MWGRASTVPKAGRPSRTSHPRPAKRGLGSLCLGYAENCTQLAHSPFPLMHFPAQPDTCVCPHRLVAMIQYSIT